MQNYDLRTLAFIEFYTDKLTGTVIIQDQSTTHLHNCYIFHNESLVVVGTSYVPVTQNFIFTSRPLTTTVL